MSNNEENLGTTEFIYSENTEFNADSVEWCPIPELSQFLACGTYHLDEGQTAQDGSQIRNGHVALYKLLSDSNGCDFKLEKTDVFDSGGVLDMKWYPKSLFGASILGVACSNGKIILLKLLADEDLRHMQPLTTVDLAVDVKNMILSLDWAEHEDSSITLVASDTLGNLNYLTMRESELSIKESWNAHSFESWIAAFDYSQPHIIYSGGDDCSLKCWDTRNISTAVFINRRHSMGVTSILKSKQNMHILATGSYDESVFLWDVRKMRIPLSEISLHGGIWRLKWHPSNPDYLLTASMHNGFHVLSVKDGTLSLKAHYDGHKSLAYGVDWCYSTKYKESKAQMHCFSNIVASCSFYDKLLHVWRINI